MSEFSPRFGILRKAAKAIVKGGAYATLAAASVGCDGSSMNQSGSQETPIMWEETWTAVYKREDDPSTPVDETAFETIPYGNITEYPPNNTTCPTTFDVIHGETWTLVPGTCTNFSVVPIYE